MRRLLLTAATASLLATPAFAGVALLGVAGLAFGLWTLFGKRSAPPAAAFATMRPISGSLSMPDSPSEHST